MRPNIRLNRRLNTRARVARRPGGKVWSHAPDLLFMVIQVLSLGRHLKHLASSIVVVLLAIVQPQDSWANYFVIQSGVNRVEYVELDTARRTSVGYLLVVVEDYFHPDLMGHLSRLRLQEIDCQKARMRVRLERRYSGKRGTGRPTAVIRQTEAGWTQMAKAGELGKRLRSRFCQK